MNGSYRDTDKTAEANACGIWARGVDGLKLKSMKFYDDGSSKRKKLVFEKSVGNVGSTGGVRNL